MAVKRRPDRHQDVPGHEPERRRPHEQARQSPDRVGGREIRRTVAAITRPSPAANIRTDTPTGRIGFGFQIREAVSAAARPMAPSQATQTVKTHRGSIGRLTSRRLAGTTFHRDESSLRPVAVEHDGPSIRFPGYD